MHGAFLFVSSFVATISLCACERHLAHHAKQHESISDVATAPLTTATAVGVWTLTDSENTTFDVVVDSTGAAISNWSKGPASAQGEKGTWTIEHGRLVIDYTDGWRDVVIPDEGGLYAKQSFSPEANRSGAPTSIGQCARTQQPYAAWVGVYEVPVGETRGATKFFMAIQSSHAAWKSIDTPNIGSWWIAGSVLRVRWANGWFDEFAPSADGYAVRSWEPGSPISKSGEPMREPTNTGVAYRMR